MVDSALRIQQFEGLTPAIDPRQAAKPLLIEGENTIVTAEGPKSAFGGDISTQDRLHNPEYVFTFTVENREIIMGLGVALIHDDEHGVYEVLFNFPDDGTLWPWTHTKVGLKHYFARRGVGEVIYDPLTNSWELGFDDIVCVTRSGGRLVYLTDFLVGWSAIDDGQDKTTSTNTGAAAQSLAIIGGGKALYVIQSAVGFVTYVEGGSQISQLVDSLNPFRHIPTVDPQVPVNAFAIAELENNRHIILSDTGLFILQGSQLTEFQPLFNEFLREQVLLKLRFVQEGVIRLTYDTQRKYLYLSISTDERPGQYDFAWVLSVSLEKWGKFSHFHHTFGKFRVFPDTETGYNFGYIARDDYVYHFNDLDRDEIPIDNTNGFFWMVPGDVPVREVVEGGGTIFHYPSRMQAYTEGVVPLPGLPSSYYDPELEILVPRTFTHTDSRVIVGPFRMLRDENDSVERLSNMQNVTVGIPQQIGDLTSEDWLENLQVADTFEDWNDDSTNDRGNDDWSDIEFGFGSDFQIEILGTLDSRVVFEDNIEVLTPKTEKEVADRFINYDADSNGLYHIVQIQTVTFGQSFHLRLLEMDGIITGILGD